jgi:integrase
MRGSLKQRSPGSWSLILEFGYVRDPQTGKSKRVQKWMTFRGTRKEAERRLNDLIHDRNHGTFIAPDKRTVAEWLTEWLAKAIKPRKAASTHRTYRHIVDKHLIPALGTVRLQALTPLDVESYYASRPKLSASTLELHHMVIHAALEAAVRSRLVADNIAKRVNNKPRAPEANVALLDHCWTADEAAQFLAAAKEAGAQPAALFAVALDSGARKAELCGLKWSDLELRSGRLTIQRQLLSRGRSPEFGPVKSKTPRTVDLAVETIDLLKAHKAHQARIKMRNRTAYHDLGLMFAKEWGDLYGRQDSLGLPLQVNNLGQREYARVVKAANVRPIKFHGLRHTSATLLLSAGVPAHVVAQRLGHKRVEITLGIYGHVLPSMQRDAAAKLAALLHRS